MQGLVMKVTWLRQVDAPALGERIKQARERDSRNLTEICSALGMSTANWYRIEQEKNESLPVETLRRIEQVLGVDFGVKFD